MVFDITDFSELTAVTRVKDELSTFIETEIESLEEEHKEFLEPDSERHIFYENFEQIPKHLELKETIRKRGVDAGFWGLSMPKEVGGRSVGTLTDAIVSEFLENWSPGLRTYAVHGAGGGLASILLTYDDEQRGRYLEPLMSGGKTTCFALSEPVHRSDPNPLQTTA